MKDSNDEYETNMDYVKLSGGARLTNWICIGTDLFWYYGLNNYRLPKTLKLIKGSGAITAKEAFFNSKKKYILSIFLDYCAAAKANRSERSDVLSEFACFTTEIQDFLTVWKSKNGGGLDEVYKERAGGDFKLTYVDLSRMSEKDETLVMKTWVDVCRMELLHPLLPVSRPDVFSRISTSSDDGIQTFYDGHTIIENGEVNRFDRSKVFNLEQMEHYVALSHATFSAQASTPRFSGEPLPLRCNGIPIACLTPSALINSGLCTDREIQVYEEVMQSEEEFQNFVYQSRNHRCAMSRADEYDRVETSFGVVANYRQCVPRTEESM